jgi:hypothetical protein
MRQVDEWLKSGDYLPPALRDFHAQKDLFKWLHGSVQLPDECKDLNWVAAHIYVTDVFLWCLARRGYTLQATRTKVEGLRDLQEDVQAFRKLQDDLMAKVIFNRSPPEEKGIEP